MRANRFKQLSCSAAALIVTANAAMVMAGAHTWDVVELFSNADGTIQFVELREMGGGQFETGVNGHLITSTDTGNAYTVPGGPLATPTSFRNLLFATPAFAALPGAPTPDFIFPANMVPFFETDGDIVSYNPYDSFSFAIDTLPTDGVHSLLKNLTTPCNTPTNYAGQTGTVNTACSLRGDVDSSGTRNADDIAAFIRVKLGTPGGGDNAACAEYCTGTLGGDVQGFVNDLLS
jgi:serralysin